MVVNNVFKNQIRRNIEVYVDVLLVKCTKETDYIANLKEAFDNLCYHCMKLN